MKRKVIKQANQAYTITLPIDWARRNKISEKSELDLIDSGKSLIISSDNKVEGGKAKVIVDNFSSRNIYIHINALYARGVDEIILISKKDISSEIMKSLGNLIGFALVEQSGENYILKDISGTNYSALDSIFKRIFQMLILFLDSAHKDIFGDEKEDLESLKARDLEVNKFCLYLQRAINKMSYSDAINGRIIFAYSILLEKIGDEIERLWRTNVKYKVKKTKEIKEIFEMTQECLGKSFDNYFQFNSKNVQDIYPLRDKIREKSVLFKKLDPQTTRFIRHIVKIAEDSADLNHLNLMKNL